MSQRPAEEVTSRPPPQSPPLLPHLHSHSPPNQTKITVKSSQLLSPSSLPFSPSTSPSFSSTADSDYAYHVILALDTDEDVLLLQVPQHSPQQGDLHHPAVLSSLAPGHLIVSDFCSRFPSQAPLVPYYTPQQALQLALLVNGSGMPNSLGLRVEVKSHLNLPAWTFLLSDYSDEQVLSRVKFGLPLDRNRAVALSHTTHPNQASALRHMDQVNEFFWSEVKLGALRPWP